jgi:hypothetical protein
VKKPEKGSGGTGFQPVCLDRVSAIYVCIGLTAEKEEGEMKDSILDGKRILAWMTNPMS